MFCVNLSCWLGADLLQNKIPLPCEVHQHIGLSVLIHELRQGEPQFSCPAAAASSFCWEQCIYVPHLPLQGLGVPASEASASNLLTRSLCYLLAASGAHHCLVLESRREDVPKRSGGYWDNWTGQ